MAADTEGFIATQGSPSWRGPFDLTLENGLRVLFVQRQKSPIVELRLVVDGGFAADPDRRSGLAALATAMFSEGLLRINGAQLGPALEVLGALPQGQVMPEAAVIGMSTLNANLGDALRIFASTLTHPEFNTEDFELLQANRLALIAGERFNPFELALRVLPPLVYGAGHRYAQSFSGSGTERDVAAITLDDLRSYYATHLAPRCTALVVAGSCKIADMCARLEATFGQWRAVNAAALPTTATEVVESIPSIVIINRPGASQTALVAGLRTVARNSTHADALIVADTILGGISPRG